MQNSKIDKNKEKSNSDMLRGLITKSSDISTEYCNLSIILNGPHDLEVLEPCCKFCPAFNALYTFDGVWCSDYMMLSLALC